MLTQFFGIWAILPSLSWNGELRILVGGEGGIDSYSLRAVTTPAGQLRVTSLPKLLL